MNPEIIQDTENIHKKFPGRTKIFQKKFYGYGVMQKIAYEHNMALGTFECF